MTFPSSVSIAIGDDSDWCRALPIDIDSNLPAGEPSKKLWVAPKSGKDSLGEYLIMLLLNDYIIDMQTSEIGTIINATHKDWIASQNFEIVEKAREE